MAVLPPDPVFSLRSPDMGAVNSLCFQESERLLAGTIKGSVFLWDLQVRQLRHYQNKLISESYINAIRKSIIVACTDCLFMSCKSKLIGFKLVKYF